MLYFVRVEPLRRDVKADEIKDLLRDFGTIYRVVVHRASPFPRYNRISKQKDIFDATYAIVSYTDRHASLMAISNLDNTLKHPFTKQFYPIVEVAKMGGMEVRRAIRIREHVPVYPLVQWGNRRA
ncbi:hypothetical protein AAVH_33789 [Aphelenchoides avenae]|nr:hypothetical protein AAVH_33789 [Aphelenchus avenae]